jgi:O-methyltransferase
MSVVIPVTLQLEELRAWLVENHDATVDRDRLAVVAAELAVVAKRGIPGDIVELGCYRGAMALWLRAQLDWLGLADRRVHVFDSFQGMPAPGRYDEASGAREGEFACGVEEVVAAHRAWSLRLPVIHPGWFCDTLPSQLPTVVAFAHVDCIFYEPTLTSLAYCVPALAAGAPLVIGGYDAAGSTHREGSGPPSGARRACEDYLGVPPPVRPAGGNAACGVFRKPG